MTIRVNGGEAGRFEPGVGGTASAAALGALPWRVEAVTPSGRTLAMMIVAQGSVGCTGDAAGGQRQCRGPIALVDLSCGQFVMYTGRSPQLPAPPPQPGRPGDCQP